MTGRSLLTMVAFLAATAACNDDEPPKPAPTPANAPSASAAPQLDTPYRAAFEGKPIEFKSVFALSRGGSAVEVFFTTGKHSCEQVRQRYFKTALDEVYLRIKMAPRLQPDGKRSWSIIYAFFRNNSKNGELAKVKVSDSDVAKQVSGSFDLEMEAAGKGAPRPKLTFSGPFEAKGCGTVLEGDAAPPALEGIALNVAGESFPVTAATITRFGERYEVLFSTQGHECGNRFPKGDLALRVELDAKTQEPVKAYLRGDVLFPKTAKPDPAAFEVKPKGPLAGGTGTVPLDISGELKTGPYLTKLEGNVPVTRCAPPGTK